MTDSRLEQIRRAEEALRRAAIAISESEGGEVLGHLAGSVASILGADIGFISVFDDAERSQMRMLAFHLDGRARKPFTYPLKGTPCALVVGRNFHCLPANARQEFPSNDLFRSAGMDSYAAYPLNDGAGEPLGVIGAMHRGPLRDVETAESVLKIFAARATAAIERQRDVGERKSAEEALRASESRYRAIFNAAADSMVLRDEEFRVVDVNPAYEQMSRRPRHEAIGRSDLTMSPPGLTERVRALHHRALAGEPVMFEARARRKDGEEFDIETRGVPIVHEGRPHVLYIGRDITARKRQEEVLRASEEQYRAIFNATADALILRDADFRIVDVNAAYLALSGYTREEVIGIDRVVMNPPAIEPHMRDMHRRALAGETVTLETVRTSKDGVPHEIELRAVPVTHRGQPHVLYIGRVITERKRAEQALRSSEEQYRAIFNAAADAIVLRDEAFRIVDVNRAYELMSGYSRDEVVGIDRVMASPPDTEEKVRALHAQALAGKPFMVETERISKDGRRREVELRGVPIEYHGKPHVLYIGRDISERKRAEEERSRLEAQLLQAQRMEAIGRLAGGIAHDFNNLLAAIMGYVVLASERPAAEGDAKLAGHLEQALASARRARDLIQQMLTFSRGKRSAPRALPLAATVGESLKLVRGSLPATVEIRAALDAAAPAALVDPVQLDQVLINLCINARDAMAGVGEIAVTTRASEISRGVCASCRQNFEGRFVELSVHDNGPGIAPALAERIFEPFFSTKEAGRGSGMGLATVHGIVHEHGGHLLLESAPGQGACFRALFLPAGEAAPLEKRRAPRSTARRLLVGRVLVVDDETTVAEFMRELLGSWGLAATSLSSPLGVLERVSRERPGYDLVILDQTMPGMTGLSLARELTAARPGLPIVLYTGGADAIGQETLDAAGVKALLQKPVEPDVLYRLLEAILPA
ncbi:MAG TPA: PAS domain S-box protein [Burkholderiales bacterium]|nr:PAS domain S-box protein [Burkholderiales bacterium]